MVTAISTDLGNTAVFPALCSRRDARARQPGRRGRSRQPLAGVSRAAPDRRPEDHAVAPERAARGRRRSRCCPAALARPRRRGSVVGHRRRACASSATCRILNHYGPTETTIGSCTMSVADGPGAYAPATVPIGRPIANTALLRPRRARPPRSAMGVAGELYIGGAGVARGYVGQAELTAERFVADPFARRRRADVPHRRSRPLASRRNDRVPRAGRRAGEDPWLPRRAERDRGGAAQLPAVREAAVVAREDGVGDKRLVAYVVSGGGASPRSSCDTWRSGSPSSWSRRRSSMLDSLPLTPSGKVDRLALPGRAQRSAPRGGLRRAADAGRGGGRGDLGRRARRRARRRRGRLLRARRPLAARDADRRPDPDATLAVNLPLHSLFTSPTVALLSTADRAVDGRRQERRRRLLAELDRLSDEEVERLLAGDERWPRMSETAMIATSGQCRATPSGCRSGQTPTRSLASRRPHARGVLPPERALRKGARVLEEDGLVLFAGSHPQPNPVPQRRVPPRRATRREPKRSNVRREFFAPLEGPFVFWVRSGRDRSRAALPRHGTSSSSSRRGFPSCSSTRRRRR